MDSTHDSAPPASADLPSRWSRAVSGDREALRELAASYWYVVYAWWRRRGMEDAANATVISFTLWLADRAPQPADTGASRLREWLQARLADFAERDLPSVEDPGIEIAPEWAEERYVQEPEGTPDHIFERRWALTVLEFATEAVRAEYATRGQDALFAEVSPFANFIVGEEDRYNTTARRLGFSAGAARKAVFDFRTRHREILRGLIADTVSDAEQVDGELTALLCACGLPGSAAESAPLPTAIRHLKPDELLARAMRSVQMTSGGTAAGIWMPPSDAEVARLFPQYEMLGILGRGGMGAVYKARQIELDRLVAIKLLPLEISVDPSFADRFRREARALAKLSHVNIIAVHDFGTTSEGHLYFVMEFVEGADLSELIHRRGRATSPELTVPQAVEIVVHVCEALDYAHAKGVIHRDIKPANVMVGGENQVKVADFGLARISGSVVSEGRPEPSVAGLIVGTPDYMAPEQKRGLAVDHRADLYSLGVMLYEMLCKETPQGAFDLPSTRGIDPRLDPIITRALAAQPERRYQSAVEMKTDLLRMNEAVLAAPPVAQPPSSPKHPPFMPRRTEPEPRRPSAAPAPTPTPSPVQPFTNFQGPPRKRQRRRKKTTLFAGVILLAVAGAYVFRSQLAPLAERMPLPAWIASSRDRISQTVTNLNIPGLPSSKAWVNALTESGRIKSGNYVQTQHGLIPAPNELLLLETGGPIRDGAVRIRVARLAANGVRLFARMGPGDYSAVLAPDKVTIRGGLHAAGYAELRSYPLPAATAKSDELEVELRVVGPRISVSVNGAELGSVEDRTVTSGALGAGSFKPEKVIVSALEYLVMDSENGAR